MDMMMFCDEMWDLNLVTSSWTALFGFMSSRDQIQTAMWQQTTNNGGCYCTPSADCSVWVVKLKLHLLDTAERKQCFHPHAEGTEPPQLHSHDSYARRTNYRFSFEFYFLAKCVSVSGFWGQNHYLKSQLNEYLAGGSSQLLLLCFNSSACQLETQLPLESMMVLWPPRTTCCSLAAQTQLHYWVLFIHQPHFQENSYYWDIKALKWLPPPEQAARKHLKPLTSAQTLNHFCYKWQF